VQLFIENTDLFSTTINENSITIEIIYFGIDETELENLKVYEKLKKLFNLPITINNRKILPRNIRADFKDFLSFRFNFRFYDDIESESESESYEKMGELDINIKKE